MTVLASLDRNLTRRLAQWDEGRGFAAIRQDWSARALGLGGSVTAKVGATADERHLRRPRG